MIMGFIDDMADHHLSLFETLDGRKIIYTPYGGASRDVAGLFQSYSELASGESVDVVVSNPILSVRTQDIPEITVGDQFLIEGKDYEVVVIRPDEEGISELTLEERG